MQRRSRPADGGMSRTASCCHLRSPVAFQEAAGCLDHEGRHRRRFSLCQPLVQPRLRPFASKMASMKIVNEIWRLDLEMMARGSYSDIQPLLRLPERGDRSIVPAMGGLERCRTVA